MTKELYVVEFESANYCGAPEHCVAWASNEDEAKEAASEYADSFYYEQDCDQWHEENGEDEDPDMWANIMSAEPMSESRHLEFYNMPDQRAAFYECVNEADAPNE